VVRNLISPKRHYVIFAIAEKDFSCDSLECIFRVWVSAIGIGIWYWDFIVQWQEHFVVESSVSDE